MGKTPKQNESFSIDPSLDKSEEQKKRAQEQFDNLSLDDCVSIANEEEDTYLRLCAAKAICDFLKENKHDERLSKLSELIDRENNEWVYFEYLDVLSKIDHSLDIASYHDQLDLLRKFATNSTSEVKRSLAVSEILGTRPEQRPPWFEKFIRNRVLTDPSDWVRSEIVRRILSFSIYEDDAELTYFALQWALHTGCSDIPSYHKVKKDSKYFSNTDKLLFKDPNNSTTSIVNDVRKKYILELKEYKDSWISIIGFITFITVSFITIRKGLGWLGVILIAVIITGIVANALKQFVGTEKKLQSYSDKMLELHYNEMKEKQRFKKLSSQIITAIVAVGIGILFFLALSSENDNIIKRIWNNMTTDAKCSVISTNANEDSFLISGEPDYGITVSTKIKNIGKKGNVFVKSKVSSSEGEFERKQTIFMEAGTEKELKYQFAELTINVKNMKYSVSCTPSNHE